MDFQKIEKENLWALDQKSLLSLLETSALGLTEKECQRRHGIFGYNRTASSNPPSPIKIFFRQFKNALMIILILVSIFSFFVGETINGAIIIGMLTLNAFVGFLQEFKAEKSLEKLKKYVIFTTRVIRDGKIIRINSTELVPGDIVLVNTGDIVPADIVLLESHNLQTNESLLTGESLPIDKFTGKKATSRIPQEIKNGIFMGTSVSFGSAKGIVIHTGNSTFLGKTVAESSNGPEYSNFEKSIASFSSILFKIVFVLTLFIFAVNALMHRDVITSLLFGITLAIGITPEVLPIIVTIAISNGALKLTKKHIIVRRLNALEDLGNIDVLCTDKTGTLTEGKLHLTDYMDIRGHREKLLLQFSLLCNAFNPKTANRFLENPIDQAVWESKFAANLESSTNQVQVLDTEDFDFKKKTMGVLAKYKGENTLIVKGATESVLKMSSHIQTGDRKVRLTSTLLKAINAMLKKHEDKGFRTIAIVYKKTKSVTIKQESDKGFTFLGFLIFYDPPRKSLRGTFQRLENLSIALKIITGDSPIITREICRQVEFSIAGDQVLTGDEIEKLSDEDLQTSANKFNVFARVTPEQKYRIIVTLKKCGHVIGYLGDGINDVGALKSADVGISVDTGTDVAKDSSDVILLKKDLHVLINGVQEGRKTFSNTIKFILNTMSSSYGNVLTIALSSLFLKFIPFLPSQVLLIDQLSDAQHLTVSTDNVDKEFLTKPRKWNPKFFIRFMLFFGIISTVFDFLLIAILMYLNDSPETFRTMWFIESSLSETLATFAIRTRRVFFKSRPSLPFLATSILVLFLTILIPSIAFGQKIFSFTKISVSSIAIILMIVAIYFIVLELAKHAFYALYKNKEEM